MYFSYSLGRRGSEKDQKAEEARSVVYEREEKDDAGIRQAGQEEYATQTRSPTIKRLSVVPRKRESLCCKEVRGGKKGP